jgi:hypothetical protein
MKHLVNDDARLQEPGQPPKTRTQYDLVERNSYRMSVKNGPSGRVFANPGAGVASIERPRTSQCFRDRAEPAGETAPRVPDTEPRRWQRGLVIEEPAKLVDGAGVSRIGFQFPRCVQGELAGVEDRPA